MTNSKPYLPCIICFPTVVALFCVCAMPFWSVVVAQPILPTRGIQTNLVLVTPPTGPVPQSPVFSEKPTTGEIRRARVFEEPLIPMWGEPSPEENAALAQALTAFAQRIKPDDFSALTEFLNSPQSAHWYASLLFCLGWEYYHTGFFSKALDSWEQLWWVIDTGDTPEATRLFDRTIGELAKMQGRIGRAERLEEILDGIKDRRLTGSATENVAAARQALWLMRNEPEVSFRCGPLALRSVAILLRPDSDALKLIGQATSTTDGVSLWQLQRLAQDMKLNLQVAKLQPGVDVPVPSVVHWRLDHYGALIRKDGNRYLLADPTFGNNLWISRDSIDAEASGYFLVPVKPGPQLTAQSASDEEIKTIWGRGVTTGSDLNNTTPYDLMSDPDCSSAGMATHNVHLFLVNLHIEDTPLGFTPPRGPPVMFTATYNHREANQPANFSYANFGQKWTCNWLSYISDNGPATTNDVDCYLNGGGTQTFKYDWSTNNGTYVVQWQSQASLLRTSTNAYQMTLRDGSRRIYSQPDGTVGTTRKVFLTQVIDPTGYSNVLSYSPDLCLLRVTDPQANATNLTFFYNGDLLAGCTNTIQRVKDRYGRSALFGYPFGLQQVEAITDVIGLMSQVVYTHGAVNRLQTPYGSTDFAFGDDGNVRWLETVDAQGDKTRVEYNQSTSLGIPVSDPGPQVPLGLYTRNFRLFARNSFYWDKKAMREAPGDYSKARVYHWLHSDGNEATSVGVLESYKEPLESRVWYNYVGQENSSEGATILGAQNLASRIARVLDDGNTQLYRFYRNSLGRITNAIDPIGRSFSFIYSANQIDLLEIRQTRGANNELLASFSYNSQHLPLIATDAAGQISRFAFNSSGQLTAVTNALNQITLFNYDGSGRLLSIDPALAGTNDSVSFTYDAFDRVRTVTDADGYTITTDYDAFDRPITNSFPDGTTEIISYKYLDPETFTDRLGRVTSFVYNPLRQLKEIHDGANSITRLDWCRCGDLKSITDPLGQVTQWFHDIQGRVTAKQYADASRIEYTYENNTSRVKSLKNERGQVRTFVYDYDNNLLQVAYANSQVTPTATFFYDTNYNRLTTVVDGIGTTSLSYYPISATQLGAGRLKQIDFPGANDAVVYDYDALGRIWRESVANPIPADGFGFRTSLQFDAVGRVIRATNDHVETFSYGYAGSSERLTSISSPGGPLTTFEYFGTNGDFRLKGITNVDSASTLISKFAYDYNRAGQITNWVQAQSGQATKTNVLVYDELNQLTNVIVLAAGGTNATYSYGFDLARNRTIERTNGNAISTWFNPANQLIGKDNGNSVTNRSFEWDEENRLVAVNQGNRRTEISYSAFGKPTVILEKQSGNLLLSHYFIWSLGRVVEERIADTNNVGTYQWHYDDAFADAKTGAPVFKMRDHLGSIRELTLWSISTGVLGQYDYDPFGRRKTLASSSSTLISIPNFSFAGLYTLPAHDINLATHRAYDPDLGRWLSRDPITEAGGLNLYRYAGNDPVNQIDPDGLCAEKGGIFGEGQFRDPNTGLARDLAGNRIDELNSLTPTPSTVTRAGPRLGSLTPAQARQIQAFADRFGAEVNVVGSRAAGTAKPFADFDYVVGGNAKLRHAAAKFLPRNPQGVIGTERGNLPFRGIDIFNGNKTPLDPTRPFIQFRPGQPPVVGP